MSEEEKFECVLGLGECKVLKWIREQTKILAMRLKAAKPPEGIAGFDVFLEYMQTFMSTVASIDSLGNFCIACVELRKSQAELFKPKQETTEK